MTVRTFRQEGKGYGSAPVEIRAKINDTVIYEGSVSTVDETVPVIPNDATVVDDVLFTWESTVDFVGSFNMVIEVLTPGTFVVSDTLADHSERDNLAAFGSFYLDGEVGDPFTSVTIGDIPVDRVRDVDPTKALNGQWWYIIDSTQPLAATVSVQAGIEPPVEPPVQENPA